MNDRVINFLTYSDSDSNFSKAKDLLVQEISDFYDFNKIYSLSDKNLPDSFKEKFKDILDIKRGVGLWIWKPFIVYNILNSMNDGEYLIYLDSGFKINNNGKRRFYEYFDMIDESDYDMLVFLSRYVEGHYTKMEIFNFFDIDTNSLIVNSKQIFGGALIIKKTDQSMKIIREWMNIIKENPDLITNNINKIIQFNEFVENRNDQSILSILCKQHGVLFVDNEIVFLPDWNTGINYPFWAMRRGKKILVE